MIYYRILSYFEVLPLNDVFMNSFNINKLYINNLKINWKFPNSKKKIISQFTEIVKSKADHTWACRQRKRKEKFLTARATNSIPSARTSTAAPNLVLNHASLRPQSLTFHVGSSTSSASQLNLEPSEVQPSPYVVKRKTSIKQDVDNWSSR